MKRNWLSAAAALSVLAASAVAAAAPGQYGSSNRGGGVRNAPAAYQGRGSFGGAPARPSYSRPAAARPAYSRPVAVRPSYSRPVYTRPAYSRPVYTRPAYSRPVYTRPAYSRHAYARPVVYTAYHRGWLSRLSTLRASAYNFATYQHYSIAARQAELVRLETELATIQASESWLTSSGEYSELVRQILSLRASLGAYAPAPIANLTLAL